MDQTRSEAINAISFGSLAVNISSADRNAFLNENLAMRLQKEEGDEYSEKDDSVVVSGSGCGDLFPGLVG
jgi:hypothetical protein